MRDRENISGILIGRALIAGVSISAAIVLIGAVLYLYQSGARPVSYRAFRGEPESLRTIGGVLSDTISGSGRGFVQLGLIILVTVQWIRVVTTAMLFARERDWLYTLFSLFILGVLLYGFFGA